MISALTQREHLTEIVELPQDVHPWFMGVQFHPEFKSTPWGGHPLFNAFIKAALEHQARRSKQGTEGGGMKLCGFDVGLDQPFFLIAGPCVVESEQLQMDVGRHAEGDHRRRSAFPSSSRAATTRPTARRAPAFAARAWTRAWRSWPRSSASSACRC